MEILITTTFAIIIGFSSINVVVSFFSYLQRPELVYKISGLFWITLIINFILQSLAQDQIILILASFSFSLIPVNLLCLSLHAILNEKYFSKTAFVVSQASILMSLSFWFLDFPFLYCALPLSIAAGFPLALTAYRLSMAPRNQKVFKFISFVLVLFLVHGFNFAFFRMDASTQIWGWTIAYALYQAIATLLPVATLSEFHFRESSRMKDIIDKQTVHLENINKDLKSSVSFKNFLFRTLAHDISTPLMISNASLGFFKSKNPTFVSDENIGRFERSIAKMIQISNDLKQIENNHLELNPNNVLDCILNAEESLKSFFESKNINLIFNHESLKNFNIFVHKTSFINSVLGNILRNSIKFSPRSKDINVDVRLVELSKVCIEISNIAEAIPEMTLNGIFDFNFEKNRLGSEGEEGTGWGLPICKVFMEKYDGSIEITSKPIKDSSLALITVYITLKGQKLSLEDSLRVS